MASKLLREAAAAVKAKSEALKRVAKNNEESVAVAVGGLAGLAAAAGGAIVDQKLGKGEQYKVGPVPVNAIAGAVALVPAFFARRSPVVRASSVAVGTQLLGVAAYRVVLDNVDPGAPDE